MRLALRGLASQGRGDVLPRQAELAGFYRLRVGGCRIVYSHHPGQVIRLEYADLREFVYERFLRLLKETSTQVASVSSAGRLPATDNCPLPTDNCHKKAQGITKHETANGRRWTRMPHVTIEPFLTI